MAVNVIFHRIQLIFNCTSEDKAAETASKFLYALCLETVYGILRAWLVLFVGILILGDDMITKITNTLPLVYKALSNSGRNTTTSKKCRHSHFLLINLY